MTRLRFDVITLFPELVRTVSEHGVAGRGFEQGLLQLVTWNPRDFTHDRHRTVDDRPYGGGPGMVMKPEPLLGALAAAQRETGRHAKVVLLSPQGSVLTQASVRDLARCEGLILIAGRYEGIDERFIQQYVDAECSIGDYVISGGELAAMVLIDAVARMLPGVLGDAESALQDSFMEGLLDYPHYTRPESWDGRVVPEVLLSGDHKRIARWRRKQALGRTWQRRSDLLAQIALSDDERSLLREFQSEVEVKDHSE